MHITSFSFVTPTHSFSILLFNLSVLAAMVAPSCWRSGRESQPAKLSPHHTWPTNVTAWPGLPDNPAPRHASKQKHADEEQVSHAQEAKKSAFKDAYHWISTVQANMVLEQEDITKVQAAVHSKPHMVQKKVKGEALAVLGLPVNLLPAHNPCKSNYTLE